MLKKAIKKITCGVLALSACLTCATFTACETSKPEIEMQIEFNGKSYTLEYTLFRKVAPATVEHFLTLVENGYYDGLCVHDYHDDKLFIGSYSYENDNLVYKKYYDVVKNYDKFPSSVWADKSKAESTYTLYGEFFANADFTVENGSLVQTFGSLTMYYTDKDVDETVAIEKHNGDGMALRQYRYNSATSQFFISVDTEDNTDSNYCTFGLIDEDSSKVLLSLQTDILTYISDVYGDEGIADFALETEMEVDKDDRFVGDRENVVTYHVPQKPIVIKKIKVNKY